MGREREIVAAIEEVIAKSIPKMTKAIAEVQHSYSVPLRDAAAAFRKTDTDFAKGLPNVAAETSVAEVVAAKRLTAGANRESRAFAEPTIAAAGTPAAGLQGSVRGLPSANLNPDGFTISSVEENQGMAVRS